jgi:hypothetical protein
LGKQTYSPACREGQALNSKNTIDAGGLWTTNGVLHTEFSILQYLHVHVHTHVDIHAPGAWQLFSAHWHSASHHGSLHLDVASTWRRVTCHLINEVTRPGPSTGVLCFWDSYYCHQPSLGLGILQRSIGIYRLAVIWCNTLGALQPGLVTGSLMQETLKVDDKKEV